MGVFKKLVSIFTVMNLVLLTSASCGNVEASYNNSTDTATESAITLESASVSESVISTSVSTTDKNEKSEAKKSSKKTTKKVRSAMEIVSDMRIGWNLGNTLDSYIDGASVTDSPDKFETAWGNPKTTQQLIDTVIDNGFNVIRIPVTWKNHIGPAPSYTITQSWLDRVKEVVDYAYNKGAYVIIDTHHEDWNYPYYSNLDAASAEMKAVWSQIAKTFKDYDEHLIFEGQNEPRKVGTSVEWTGGDQEGWDVVNQLNKVFVDTVRASGGQNDTRLLMICGYGANSTVGIKHIEIPNNDNRIIISVHAYEPYNFALNTSGRSAWNADATAIDTLMSNLKTLYIDKGIPVIIGEFGALNKNNEDERAAWASYYVIKARQIGVPCIWWDNGGFGTSGENFGLIDRSTYVWRYPKILAALIQASTY